MLFHASDMLQHQDAIADREKITAMDWHHYQTQQIDFSS